MIHTMRLAAVPFEAVASGRKTIEIRLNDEKRRRLRVGDNIVFVSAENPQRAVRVTVVALHPFPSFSALYAAFPPERCGYTPEEAAEARYTDMYRYYSPEQERQFGVLGIEIARIPEG